MNSRKPNKKKKAVRRKVLKNKAGNKKCCNQKTKHCCFAWRQNLSYLFMFKKSLLKIFALILIVALNWAGLAAIGSTLAYFYDNGGSTNLLQATTLDFILTSPTEFLPEQIFPGQPSLRDITIVNVGDLNFDYDVRAEKISGDDSFCDVLQLEAKLGDTVQHLGSLFDFVSPSTTFPTSTPVWSYSLSLPVDTVVTGSETCQFKFIYDGWQQNLSSGQGFHDEEEITSTIQAPLFCSAYSPGYFVHHDGCTADGNGSSVWASQVNALSTNYSSVFANTTGEEICQNLWEPLCPKSNTLQGKICRAKRQTLADLLNVVSNNLDTNALIAGADNGSGSFDLLGLSATSTVNQALQTLESTLANASSTVAQINAVTVVGDRIHTYYEDENQSYPGCAYSYDVVINEFLPNPVGDDKALKPNGEWIELYNRSQFYINVAGWKIYDNNNDHSLTIGNDNTDTGSTLIPPLGFLVVYRNGDSDFELNNTGGDSVRLFNGRIASGARLLDAYTYDIAALPGKSFARIPDGSPNWVDPIPTPGEPNLDPTDILSIDYPILMCVENSTCFDEMADSPEVMTETEPELPLPNSLIDIDEVLIEETDIQPDIELLPTSEAASEVNNTSTPTTTEEIVDTTPEVTTSEGEEVTDTNTAPEPIITPPEVPTEPPTDIPTTESTITEESTNVEPIVLITDSNTPTTEETPPDEVLPASDTQPSDQTIIMEQQPAIEQEPITVPKDPEITPDTGTGGGADPEGSADTTTSTSSNFSSNADTTSINQ